ncbi:glycosyltransferase family 2 protein [Paenibacillus sp. NPDC058174]|uniref:glycosyltransferase family 2 protein n=1 Tax=Paenibacillus sp. NPDC058174 TaxID=3346366 RepID=UPI0036DC96B3
MGKGLKVEHIQLSIVIPVYNSQDTIGLVVESLIRLYHHLFSLEIILVNDDSKDNSRLVCENLRKRYAENIIVIHHETNGGQHRALMTGLRHSQGNLVVLMDDDMQNPPKEVIKLINKINEGYDVVIGKRTVYNQSWIRKLLSDFNQVVVFISTKQRVSFSNFLIMRREVVTKIIEDQSSDPVIQGLILQSTANMTNVLTVHNPRKHGRSNYTVAKLFKHGLNVSSYISPSVKYSLFLLIIMMIVGLAAGAYYLLRLCLK